ncbi:hypothetical protein SESBI_17217 [Sesbania bispinosa]|nr:hypothetical protein SESBI_17217 [Sesbania bispinosa]
MAQGRVMATALDNRRIYPENHLKVSAAAREEPVGGRRTLRHGAATVADGVGDIRGE